MIRCHLSTLLGARKLKMIDVFRATNISQSTLAAIYHERAKGIDYQTVEKLCRFLNVSVGELLTLEDDGTVP